MKIVDSFTGEISLTYCPRFINSGLLDVPLEFVKKHFSLNDEQVQEYLEWRSDAHTKICHFIEDNKIDVYYDKMHSWALGRERGKFYIRHSWLEPRSRIWE